MKKATYVTITAVAVFGIAGCSKITEPWNDADVTHKDDRPAEIGSMPDGFSNWSSKCDRHGNRVYVLYHSDSPYGGIDVVSADPTCKRSAN